MLDLVLVAAVCLISRNRQVTFTEIPGGGPSYGSVGECSSEVLN